MKKVKVRTIIVDLDKTLLRTDKTISPYTAAVLRKCNQYGIKIMVATARPQRNTEQYLETVNFDAMVVSNGSRVICGNLKKEYGICEKSAEQLLGYLKSITSLCITLETGDCAYSNKPVSDYETIICDDLLSVAKEQGALKILVSFDNDETLKIVEKILPEDLYYTIANGHLIQIMSRSATKWNGIRAMLEISACPAEETVYFGDDYDDIEPIRMCGVGVAVANAIDEVKGVADYITGTNDEDGVAKFIKELFSKEFQ